MLAGPESIRDLLVITDEIKRQAQQLRIWNEQRIQYDRKLSPQFKLAEAIRSEARAAHDHARKVVMSLERAMRAPELKDPANVDASRTMATTNLSAKAICSELDQFTQDLNRMASSGANKPDTGKRDIVRQRQRSSLNVLFTMLRQAHKVDKRADRVVRILYPVLNRAASLPDCPWTAVQVRRTVFGDHLHRDSGVSMAILKGVTFQFEPQIRRAMPPAGSDYWGLDVPFAPGGSRASSFNTPEGPDDLDELRKDQADKPGMNDRGQTTALSFDDGGGISGILDSGSRHFSLLIPDNNQNRGPSNSVPVHDRSNHNVRAQEELPATAFTTDTTYVVPMVDPMDWTEFPFPVGYVQTVHILSVHANRSVHVTY